VAEKRIETKRSKRLREANRWGWLWLVVLLLVAIVIYITFGAREPGAQQRNYWPYLFGFAAIAALIIGVLFVLIRYVWWWSTLANRPMWHLKEGNKEAAETAFEKASAYARALSRDDYRRGAMLTQLAMYLGCVGRHEEALAFHQEAIAILEPLRLKRVAWFLSAINNYALYLTQCRRFAEALAVFEKLVDLVPIVKKPNAAGRAGFQTETFEMVFRTNMAALLMELGEMKEARLQLEAADELLPNVGKRDVAFVSEVALMYWCLWKCAAGLHAEAENDLQRAHDPELRSFLRARASICMARGEYEKAERLARKALAGPDVIGPLHRPESVPYYLDVAESIHGQGRADEAFLTFQKARSIFADFALPPDAAWRKSLETWLQRARQLGKADVAASLEAELQAIPATANQAITILEKFRVRRTTPTPIGE
jgi:tetratricopeptide (TPR) repeat protein